MASEYVFVDEWDVDAPQEVVYEILADARTYPEWWRPVYGTVEDDRQSSRGAGRRTSAGTGSSSPTSRSCAS